MRKLLLSAFAVLLVLVNTYGADESPEALVLRWNALHNNGEKKLFKTLYGDKVLFYGRYRSGAVCAKQKIKFVTPEFRQEIIGEIKTTVYNTGTIKCSFDKKTIYRQLVKEHACYLLLGRINGRLQIVGESSDDIDQRLGVTLHLGTPVSGATGAASVLFPILFGLAALALVGWYLRRIRHQKSITDDAWISSDFDTETITMATVADPVVPTPPSETEMITKVKVAVLEELKSTALPEANSKEKGDAFERFVVERFDKTYFQIEEWRSDKFHEGYYAKSNLLPDLEISFKYNSKVTRFCIECKWRSGFRDGKIEWAKDRQLRTYKDHARKTKMPVFVVIGIGGKPDDPEALYILPINKISTAILTEKQLQGFYRNGKGHFFFNPDKKTLG